MEGADETEAGRSLRFGVTGLGVGICSFGLRVEGVAGCSRGSRVAL